MPEWEDDQLEETQGAEDGDGDGEEEQDAPEFDDAQQAYVQRQIAAERQKWEQERTSQTSAELQATMQRLEALERQLRQPAQPQPPPPAAEERAPEYDPYDQASVDRYIAWQIQQGNKGRDEQNQQLRQMLAEDRVERAMDRAETVIGQFPHLAPFLNHPEFRATYREALATQDPRLLSDRQNLVAMAAMITTALDPAQIPAAKPAAQQRPRDEQGRFEADIHRQGLQANSPSRGGGGPQGSAQVDPEEQRIAAIAGMTVEELRAYGSGTTYEDHQRFQEAQRRKGRR